MCLTSRRSRWARVRSALWWGIPLGLLQLMLGLLALRGTLDWLLCALVGAILYIVLPGLAGFRAAPSAEEGQLAGSRAGCMAGIISFALMTISACVFAILLFTSMPPPGKTLYHPLPGLTIFYVGAVLGVAFLNAMGAVLAYFGGWVGGSLADRLAPTHNHASAVSEDLPNAS